MNQSFSKDQLLRLCKQSEYIRYGLSIDDLKQELIFVQESILNETFEFEISATNNFYNTPNLAHKLVLRKLNDNIKRIYKDEQANRKLIIQQIITLLQEDCPFWIIKTDISCFYESINAEKIISKLSYDSILSYHSIFLLNKIFKNSLIHKNSGLPKGINISSTLSEIYLRKFDKWIQRHKGVYYYARFVDDIVIFLSLKEEANEVISKIKSKLNELCEGLNINETKTEFMDGNDFKRLKTFSKKRRRKSFDYLGYCFERNKEQKLIVSIAPKKIKKIKTRIVLAFLDYIKNFNFNLLEKRIKFLTGNYSIKKDKEGSDLKAGIFYNYSLINDNFILDDLNIFYRKTLFSKKTSFGSRLQLKLNLNQKNRLKKYCFKSGFYGKVYNPFTYEEMKQIISCWK